MTQEQFASLSSKASRIAREMRAREVFVFDKKEEHDRSQLRIQRTLGTWQTPTGKSPSHDTSAQVIDQSQMARSSSSSIQALRRDNKGAAKCPFENDVPEELPIGAELRNVLDRELELFKSFQNAVCRLPGFPVANLGHGENSNLHELLQATQVP